MDPTETMHDIQESADLLRLIERFYQKLLVDPEIGHFFTQVVSLDLEHHIPKIASFWESVLFQRGDYSGDPMSVHIALHGKSPMEYAHFQRWVGQFCETVDEMFVGRNAETAKQRAHGIATLMQVKIKRAALGQKE